jgi:dihydroorotase
MPKRLDSSKFMSTGPTALGSNDALVDKVSPFASRLETGAPAQPMSAQVNTTNAPTLDMDPWRTLEPPTVLQVGQFETWTRTMQTGLKYDLLIKGGTVIDPDQHLHAVLDVAVKDGKISQLATNIPPEPDSRVISAVGKIVTPGFIDLHVHCYYGVAFGVDAEHYCVGRGTTTVVEAGSTGYLGIGQFVKDIVTTSLTRVYAMVHIVPVGDTTSLEHLLDDMKNVDPQWTAMAAEANKPSVVAIKAHLSTVYSSNPKDTELVILQKALDAAEACHLPLMVHINETYYPLSASLKMLRKGDIFTHCFSKFGPIDSPLDANGKILPAVREARDRGVIFDVASGLRHFSFDVAEKCLQLGFMPDTISTDLNGTCSTVRVYDMPTMVSKFLAIGMDLDKAIECVTINPSKVFNFGVKIGTLRPGSEADIGIFELREGNFEFVDAHGAKRVGHQRLVNKAVVCRGRFLINEV